MIFVVAGLLVLAAGGAIAWIGAGRPLPGRIFGPGSAAIGCALILVDVIRFYNDGQTRAINIPWSLPGAAWFITIDRLSAFFLIPVLVICMLAALYGHGYLRHWDARRAERSWLYYNLLAASMVLVVLAHNAVLFLLAWEMMALTSFFLVIFEDEKAGVRRAGWLYLIATHVGTACLLVMFLVLGARAGSLDFDIMFALPLKGSQAGVIFLLALIGFGVKAGFMPLHIWLPEAHPAAPSHVSAVMSGVMIKTGIYGLFRILVAVEAPPAWWGWTLLAVGAVSGVMGILYALAQHDLKRLLAYSSVENIGIIGIGLGLGLLGITYDQRAFVILGLGGSLMHVFNHAVFKSLLFMCAGAVAHATGTRSIDRLGGLLKLMPVSGSVFAVGAVAICGLPPLNGFVSEFMIYRGALDGLAGSPSAGAMPVILAGLVAILALVVIGALSIACFAKVFGAVFLGAPRQTMSAVHGEVAWSMRLPMVALVVLCVIIGLGAPLMFAISLPSLLGGFAIITMASTVLLFLVAGLLLVRRILLDGRPVTSALTWDCGYAAPNARMQYTGSSFAAPIKYMFRRLLHPHERIRRAVGLFPAGAAFEAETHDLYRKRLYEPVFGAIGRTMERLRWLQHGRLNLYILGVVVALLVLLAWKMS